MRQAIAFTRARTSARLPLAVLSFLAVVLAPLALKSLLTTDAAVVSALGYPAIFLVHLVGGVTPFFPVPCIASVFASGAVLNPLIVAPVAAVGMTLGMTVCYFLGLSGSPLLHRLAANRSAFVGTLVSRIEAWFIRYGLWSTFVLAAVPSPFIDLSALWAGAIRMPLWKFMLGTFLGKAVQSLAIALAGAHAISALGLGG